LNFTCNEFKKYKNKFFLSQKEFKLRPNGFFFIRNEFIIYNSELFSKRREFKIYNNELFFRKKNSKSIFFVCKKLLMNLRIFKNMAFSGGSCHF